MADEARAVAWRSIARTVAALARADARDEALAELVPERRLLGVPRPARMTPVTRVWRLGVLLLDRDGTLYATGSVTRAIAPKRTHVPSRSAETRRELQAAAARGPFAEGETVNFDAVPIDLESLGEAGPLVVRDGFVQVRWSPALPSALVPLEDYLADRAGLLLESNREHDFSQAQPQE